VLFCVSWNQFLFVLFDLSVLRSVFFNYKAKRLAGKNVSEMTYIVSSGVLRQPSRVFVGKPWRER